MIRSLILACLLSVSLAPPVVAAPVNLSWTAPTQNADGSPLTDLAGYKAHYGSAPGNYSQVVDVHLTTQASLDLPTGTYYLVVTAYDTASPSNESAPSNEVSATVQAPVDTTPPTVGSTSITPGATGVDPNVTLTATFNEAMDPASINATTVELRDAAGTLILATISYNQSTRTVSIDPAAPLLANTTYTAKILGGPQGVKDLAGNALAQSLSWSFTTAPASQYNCPCSVFAPSDVPVILTDPETASLELGMKFKSAVAGKVTGVRFYKSTQNTGTHQGHLWSRTGTRLASVTFTNETASGWQQMNFATPINIQANTTYVISVHVGSRYSATNDYFTAAKVTGPLTALKDGTDGGNGVYRYGSNVFPNQTWHASWYGIDLVFMPNPS